LLGAMETNSDVGPALPTPAYEYSPLESVRGAVTEEAGVLGAGLAVLSTGVEVGGVLFITERLIVGDMVDWVDGGGEKDVLIAGAFSGSGSVRKTKSKRARLKLGKSTNPRYAGVDSSKVIRLAFSSLCLNWSRLRR
jgi:hypothetical protein